MKIKNNLFTYQQLRLRHDTLRKQHFIYCNINYNEILCRTEALFNSHFDLDYLDSIHWIYLKPQNSQEFKKKIFVP